MDKRLQAELRERLRRLGVRRGTRHISPQPTYKNRPASLEATIGGQEIITPRGAFHLCEHTLPPDHFHGRYPLGRVLSAPLAPLRDLFTPPGHDPIPVQQMAFLDTETLGLSGGTGTSIFLVGVGIIGEEGIHVRQYFLRDLHEEPAMLEHLANDLARWDIRAIITYNGRSFDLPLLETRCILNAVPSPWPHMAHLDLLIHARRLWRPRLHRCSLAHVEKQILGHQRGTLDIPGWLIPTIYKEYLRTRNPAPLRQIFYHNLHDILSLIALTDILLRAWHDPWSEPALAPEDFVARGRYLLEMGQEDVAEASFRHALHHATSPSHRRHAYMGLGSLLKRQHRWEDAIPLWQAWIAEFPEDLHPYEELAKYYEWHARDLDQALEWTQRALATIEHMQDAPRARWEPVFRHRAARLRRRLERRREER